MSSSRRIRVNSGRGCRWCDASELFPTISKSVGLGGANLRDDVLLVQRLLNAVPPEKAGPVPPLVEDGLVGPKTIGAIRTYQTRVLGWADGRVDPGGPTFEALLDNDATTPRLAASSASGGVTMTLDAPSADPVRRAMRLGIAKYLTPQVKNSLDRALHHVDLAADFCARQARGVGSGVFDSVGERDFTFLAKHFRLEDPARSRPQVARIRGVIWNMKMNFERNINAWGGGMWGPHLYDRPRKEPRIEEDILAYTYMGGWHMSGQKAFDGEHKHRIYWCNGIDNEPKEVYIHTAIHEMAHFVGPTHASPYGVTDHGYTWEHSKFDRLTQFQRLTNAESYANYVFELSWGSQALFNARGQNPSVLYSPTVDANGVIRMGMTDSDALASAAPPGSKETAPVMPRAGSAPRLAGLGLLRR